MNSKRRFRFGIGVIFFAMVVVAGYFWGLNRGDTVRYNTTLSSVVYPALSSLSGEQSIDVELNEIANLIKLTIAPDTWIEQGGLASLDIYPSNQCIVVNQCGMEHAKISELLDSLEQVAREKRYSVEYDVSEIFSAGIQKPSYEQLDELCVVTTQKMIDVGVVIDVGVGEFKLTPVVDAMSIRIVARKDVHSVIATYLEQLRGARRLFARIDS